MADKLTLEQMAKKLRDEYDIDPSRSDDDLVRGYLKKHPEAISQMQTTTSRRGPVDSATSRLLKGASEPLTGIPKFYGSAIKEGVKETGKDIKSKGALSTFLNPSNWAYSKEEMADYDKQHPKPEGGLGEIAKGATGVQSVTDKFNKGDTAGAIGNATTQTLMMALPFMRGKGAGLSKVGEVEEFSNLTQRRIQPLMDTLSEQGEAIKGSMDGQLANVTQLRGNPLFRKTIARLADLETAPGTPKAAVSAAKDSLEQLSNQINSGKATTWNDLFEMQKSLKNATSQIKDPAVNGMLRKITDLTGQELSDSAGKVPGMGKAYDTWQENYAKASDLGRRYDQVLRGRTDAQMAKKASAKGTKLKIAGTDLGSSRMNKMAGLNKSLIGQAHKAMDELHGQIKSAPKPSSGTFMRTPRANPLEHPEPNPAPVTPVPKATPIPPVSGGSTPQAGGAAPQWPAEYQNAPKTLDASGSGGANYTADQLAAFKKKHGIQ